MEGAGGVQEKNIEHIRCVQCLAVLPAEVNACPKCGGTVFVGGSSSGALRSIVRFFSTPSPFYVKARPPKVVDGDLVQYEVEWTLYMAKLQQDAPFIFLWDRDGYLLGKQDAALHLVEPEDVAAIITALPEKNKKKLKDVLRNGWGIHVLDDQDLLEKLRSTPLFYQPVPRLKDPAVLKKMDWHNYVEKLACPKQGKDPRLVTVHLAKIPVPLAMFYAPHSLEVTNPNTGKTRFYDAAGVKVDKATRKSVLGFAKSPEEIYPGTINGTNVPVAFDQVESQDSYELAKYMLDVLETGRANVDSGGIRFTVETHSSFAYLGNPIAKNAKVIEGFKALLDHVCANPAMGRRFGIILFSTDLKSIKSSEKMTLQELEQWKSDFTLFRAVEEYAQLKLKHLIMDQKVSEWLHQPIKGYREIILRAVEQLDDYNLVSFFESHAEATHRVRGAALHAAIALLLDRIALGEVKVDEILAEAEELLPQYVEINLSSIANLCQMWDQLRAEQAKAFFENAPDYLREIISACIHYKRANPAAVSVQLSQIPYEPGDKQTYRYFSKCIDRLKRRKNLSNLNDTLRSLFGFQIIGDGQFTAVEYFESPKPPEDLPLIGKYDPSTFLNFSDFSISQLTQTKNLSVVDMAKRQGYFDSEQKEIGDSENTEKLRKSRNGEKAVKPQCVSSMVFISVNVMGTCSSCGFYRRIVYHVSLKSSQWACLCEICGPQLKAILEDRR